MNVRCVYRSRFRTVAFASGNGVVMGAGGGGNLGQSTAAIDAVLVRVHVMSTELLLQTVFVCGSGGRSICIYACITCNQLLLWDHSVPVP